MASVKQSGTKAECQVRDLVDELGFEFDINVSSLPGSPDLSNIEHKWAIFVHGCFWHAHEGCKRWKIPKRNREYWEEKFKANRERDRRKTESLKKYGYSVLVLWECDLQNIEILMPKLKSFLETNSQGMISEPPIVRNKGEST